MIIDQLPALATAGDNDEIAIEVGTTTYKMTKSNFLKEFMPKSGGEFTGNVTVNGVLNVTPRRCYASLSQSGWYRVLKIVGGIGGWSFSVDFDITRVYNSTNNEVHSVKMLKTYSTNPSFVNEASKTNILVVSKIRYTIDGNGVGYVDIWYDSNESNTVTVDFTVHTNPNQQPYFTVESLQSVVASPSDETVMTEYTFSANTRALLTTNIFRIRRTYSNITISSNNGYTLLDSFESMGVSSQSYCLGLIIVGWSGFSTYGFQIMRGSNATSFYLASSVAGTFGSFTVEYWFADLSA